MSVVELALAYWRHARACYRRNGRPTGSIPRIRVAVRTLRTTYGSTPAKNFGPLAFQTIQRPRWWPTWCGFWQLTGCRPAEVCLVRPCDVDTSGDVWIYRPELHKTEHHGRERIICIGPKGQDVLRPYLLRAEGAYCFLADRLGAEAASRVCLQEPRRCLGGV